MNDQNGYSTFGLLLLENLHPQKTLKIAQSGHTGWTHFTLIGCKIVLSD